MFSFYANLYLAFVEMLKELTHMPDRVKKKKKKEEKWLYCFLICKFSIVQQLSDSAGRQNLFSSVGEYDRIHAQLAIKICLLGWLEICIFKTVKH